MSGSTIIVALFALNLSALIQSTVRDTRMRGNTYEPITELTILSKND